MIFFVEENSETAYIKFEVVLILFHLRHVFHSPREIVKLYNSLCPLEINLSTKSSVYRKSNHSILNTILPIIPALSRRSSASLQSERGQYLSMPAPISVFWLHSSM